jgi:pheromone shutdown protein TraB
MGLRRKDDDASQMRAWMGNLLAAWTFVTGLAVTFASAWWYRTRDIKILIAYVGAPVIVGLALFLTLGIMAAVMRTKPRKPVEADGVRARKQREAWFGR